MFVSKYQEQATTKEMVSTFGGYCHRDVIADGQWWDMENLSAGKYPAISTRPKRRILTKVDGQDVTDAAYLCDMDGLVWIGRDGTLHAGRYSLAGFVDLSGTGREKKNPQLVPMGAYLTVWPHRRWADISRLRNGYEMRENLDYGDIDAAWSQQNDVPGAQEKYGVTITPCQRDGSYWKHIPKGFVEAPKLPTIKIGSESETPAGVVVTATYPWKLYRRKVDHWDTGQVYYGYYIGAEEKPEDPDDGCLWMDEGGEKPALYQWYGSTRMWGPVDCYLKLEATGIGGSFRAGDAVTMKMPKVLYESAPTRWDGTDGIPSADMGYYHAYKNPLGDDGVWESAILEKVDENFANFLIVKGAIPRQTTIGSYHRQLVNRYLEAWYQTTLETSGQPPAITEAAEAEAWAKTDAALKQEIPIFGGTQASVKFFYDDLRGLEITRTAPKMDFVIECGNRLWGCYYGKGSDGKILNEIYASKLGDFKNWNYFAGLSTDSYAASRGSDGPWTGAIAFNNYPLFFKRNYLEKVYVSASGAHQIVTTRMPGVAPGSQNSLQIIDGILFYHAQDGVMCYDGSLPELISGDLGSKIWKNAAAGKLGYSYYISMQDPEGAYHLFVLDTTRGLWHREDGTRVLDSADTGNVLYLLTENGSLFTPGGMADSDEGELEEDFVWQMVSGWIGYSRAEQEQLLRVILRLKLEPGASAMLHVQYDENGRWIRAACLEAGGLRSVKVPVRPRRCDNFRIKLSGIGGATLYSICREILVGSDET